MSLAVTPSTVRAVIDLTLDESTLPDAIVMLQIYQGSALREIKAADPLWDTRTGDDEQRLNDAANLICAALLIDAIPALTEERDESGNLYKRNQANVNERIAKLRSRAQSEISAVIGDGSSTYDAPQMFGTVEGARGR